VATDRIHKEALVIPGQIFEAILSHCRAGFPNEACGILAGKGNEVSEIYRMSNIERSQVSYLMDPTEQFKAMKDMREKKMDMVGIFHSHPSSAAYPSHKDVGLAFYEEAVYVIVSLAGGGAVVKGFRIKEKEIHEVEILVKKSD
jgi:proteasome lid subunit RPN8/RPN11